MKQPVPLPTEPPFVTFYTPTFRRPRALAACIASVGRQTAAAHCEHLVLPDHAGYGVVGGLYGRMKWYAEACRGRYVHVLADDDELAGETVLEQAMRFAERMQFPPVILVRAVKAGLELPFNPPRAPSQPYVPERGEIDVSCFLQRRDVWLRHIGDYGPRYDGDYDHAVVLARQYPVHFLDLVFLDGAASNGRPEVDYR
jgi:hypothetical protein